ncbi:hypothetical protein AB0I55_22185 [Actinocatenispora sera]
MIHSSSTGTEKDLRGDAYYNPVACTPPLAPPVKEGWLAVVLQRR